MNFLLRIVALALLLSPLAVSAQKSKPKSSKTAPQAIKPAAKPAAPPAATRKHSSRISKNTKKPPLENQSFCRAG